MLKTLLFIVIAGILAYLLFNLCLYLYRPFFLSKTFREIEQMYNRLLTALEKDVGSWVETLEEWHSGDEVIRTEHRENEILESINAAKATKAHEEEVYGKFLRLRERFVLNPKKLSASIVAYRSYLQVRLQHHEDAMLCACAVTAGAFSFDDMMAARKKIMIIMKENERKLDILLTE
jgi:hypothetical protein